MIEAVHTGFEIDKLVEAIEIFENDPHKFRKEIIDTIITTTTRPKKTLKKTINKKGKKGPGLLRFDDYEFFKHGRSLKKNRIQWQGELDGLGFDSERE